MRAAPSRDKGGLTAAVLLEPFHGKNTKAEVESPAKLGPRWYRRLESLAGGLLMYVSRFR